MLSVESSHFSLAPMFKFHSSGPVAGGAASQGVKTGENRPALAGWRERSARSIVTLRSQSQSEPGPQQTWPANARHYTDSGDLHAEHSTLYNRR